MIAMEDAQKANTSSKLIQPRISTFFAAQKKNSKVLQIIKKDFTSKPQTSSPNKVSANNEVIADTAVEKSFPLFGSSIDQVNVNGDHIANCSSPSDDITSEHMGDYSNLKILSEDRAVSVEDRILTINLIEDEGLKLTPSTSILKRSGGLLDSSSTPTKKFALGHTEETMKVKCSLFNECTNEEVKVKMEDIYNQISGFDDTVNLAEYCVPICKLEKYSPSSCGKLKLELEDNTELITSPLQVKSEVDEDVDTTIICDQFSTSHICATPIPLFKEAFSGCMQSSAIQTPVFSQHCTSSSIKKEQLLIAECKPDLYPISYLKQFMKDLCKSKMVANLGEDIRILEILFELSPVHQEICIGLFFRRTKWQQLSKFLSVLEKQFPRDAIITAIHNLDELSYIHRDFTTKETLATILNHLQLIELKALAKDRRIKKAQSKKTLIECLLKFVRYQRCLGMHKSENILRRHINTKFDYICLDTIMYESLFRLHLLYHFTLPRITSIFDCYKYISAINTGSIKLPKYRVRDVSAFKDSDAFFRYSKAIELQFEYNYHKGRTPQTKMLMMEDIADTAFYQLQQLYKTKSDIVTAPVNQRFTAEHVYSKMLTQAAVDFTKKPDKVSEWLSCMLEHHNGAKRGEWYDRLAMYHKEYDKNLAAVIINKGLLDNDVSQADKITLSIRASTLIKKGVSRSTFPPLMYAPSSFNIANVVIEAQPIVITNVKRGRKTYEGTDGMFTVEEIAIRHYTKSDYNRGIHCEGSLIMTLFVTLFWDIIYQDIGDVPDPPFISSLQYIPLDLFSKKFYLRRKEVIDKRLQDIEVGWSNDEFTQRLWKFHNDNSLRKSLHDVNLAGQIAVEAAECIGRFKLQLILHRFLKDLRQCRAGLPDLFVWNYATKKCCFVEVKSHNDKLSIKQKLWLQYLAEIDVSVEVCLVNSIGQKVSKTRTKL